VVFLRRKAGAFAPALKLRKQSVTGLVRLPPQEGGNLQMVVFLRGARRLGDAPMLVELADYLDALAARTSSN
jgi:hypothetical protein